MDEIGMKMIHRELERMADAQERANENTAAILKCWQWLQERDAVHQELTMLCIDREKRHAAIEAARAELETLTQAILSARILMEVSHKKETSDETAS